MAYQGSGAHSPNYEDAHRLQDVPASQVRIVYPFVGMTILTEDCSIARMRMHPEAYSLTSKALSQRPLTILTRGESRPYAPPQVTA